MDAASRSNSYIRRFGLALLSAFVLAFAATVAVGGRSHDLASLSTGAAMTLALAVLASAASAALVPRKGIVLVLVAQGLTLLAIGILNFFVF